MRQKSSHYDVFETDMNISSTHWRQTTLKTRQQINVVLLCPLFYWTSWIENVMLHLAKNICAMLISNVCFFTWSAQLAIIVNNVPKYIMYFAKTIHVVVVFKLVNLHCHECRSNLRTDPHKWQFFVHKSQICVFLKQYARCIYQKVTVHWTVTPVVLY